MTHLFIYLFFILSYEFQQHFSSEKVNRGPWDENPAALNWPGAACSVLARQQTRAASQRAADRDDLSSFRGVDLLQRTIFTGAHTHTRALALTYIRAYIHAQQHLHALTLTCTHGHMHTHSHTHTHAHTPRSYRV